MQPSRSPRSGRQWRRRPAVLSVFVANVNVNDDGSLNVNVNRFSNDNVWNGENRHRVVVPRLALSS